MKQSHHDYAAIEALLRGAPASYASQTPFKGGIAEFFERKLRRNAEISIVEWQYFRLHLPYCIKAAGCDPKGRQAWVFLNRDYRPLGIPREACWESIKPGPAFHLKCDPEAMPDMWAGQVGWFYSDGCESRRNYIKRLGLFLSHVEWLRHNAGRQ
jgi:hypothetical protein